MINGFSGDCVSNPLFMRLEGSEDATMTIFSLILGLYARIDALRGVIWEIFVYFLIDLFDSLGYSE